MKTLTRDDTEHGAEYVLRAEAEAAIRAGVAAERDRCAAEIATLTRERDDYRERFEQSRMAQMNQISGGRYPDGRPAW